MALMRDVLARFAVLVDDKPLTKLDRRIQKLKDNVRKFGTYAAGGLAIAGAAAWKFVSAASDASETLNVLNKTFGSNAQGVIDWSKTMGKEMGRSQFSLQKYASEFGAFMEPQFKGTDQDIAHMSKRLAELSVDLASFYNTSDEEAKMRLLSGLSGETEAVRKLGIDISDTSLTDFNHKRGDNRNMAQLNLQEKTLLRFEKLLKDTQTKWGDAKDTALEFANSVRRLTDKLKDLAVRIGRLLEGPAKKLTWTIESMVGLFETLSFKTSAWQAAFTTASVVGLAYGAKWLLLHKDLVKWSDLLNKQFWMMNLKVLGIVGAFLLLEDLWTLMRGGKSVTGDLITMLTDIQRPLDLVNAMGDKLAQWTYNTGVNLREVLRNLLAIGPAFKNLDFSKFGWDTSDKITETKSEADLRNQKKLATQAAKFGDKKAFVQAMTGSGMSDEGLDQAWLKHRQQQLWKGSPMTDADRASGLKSVPALPTPFSQEGGDVATAPRRLSSTQIGGSPVTNTNTFYINGGDTAEVKRVVNDALDARDRQTAAEVAEAAEAGE